MKGANYMIRTNPPFNAKRYLLNLNTGEIHDLIKETPMCYIDHINHEHISMHDTYFDAEITASIHGTGFPANGCHFCNPSKDRG